MTSVHVKRKHCVPVRFRDCAARHVFNFNAGAKCGFALLADSLALPRRQGREKIVERTVAAVLPVKLLAGPRQKPERAKPLRGIGI